MQNSPVVATNAIIFVKSLHFILTRRADNNLWCLPGGIVEFNETVEASMLREIEEETCLNCKVERLVGVYSANNIRENNIFKKCSIILAFACFIIDGTPQSTEEVSEIGVFTFEDMPVDILPNHKMRIKHALKNNPLAYIC